MQTLTATEWQDLTPEERDAVAAAYYAERVAEPEPEPIPEPPKEPDVETYDVTRPVPRDLRVARWLDGLASFGSHDGVRDARGLPLWLWRRALVWVLRAWPRFRYMLWIQRSGPTNDNIFQIRSRICDVCEWMKVGARDGEAYCAACNCPDWSGSKLRNKNRKRFNHCARRRHPGGYIKLVTHSYPNRKEPERKAGCGAQANG